MKIMSFATVALISSISLNALADSEESTDCPEAARVILMCLANPETNSQPELEVTGAHICESDQNSFMVVHWNNEQGVADGVKITRPVNAIQYTTYKMGRPEKILTVKKWKATKSIPAQLWMQASSNVKMVCDRL